MARSNMIQLTHLTEAFKERTVYLFAGMNKETLSYFYDYDENKVVLNNLNGEAHATVPEDKVKSFAALTDLLDCSRHMMVDDMVEFREHFIYKNWTLVRDELVDIVPNFTEEMILSMMDEGGELIAYVPEKSLRHSTEQCHIVDLYAKPLLLESAPREKHASVPIYPVVMCGNLISFNVVLPFETRPTQYREDGEVVMPITLGASRFYVEPGVYVYSKNDERCYYRTREGVKMVMDTLGARPYDSLSKEERKRYII